MARALHVVREPRHHAGLDALTEPGSRFTLNTLGGLTLLDPDGREVESLASRRRKLVVLAWLAMRRSPATRDQVIGVFWGDRDESRARNSLADALSHFRRVLGRSAVPSFSERVALADDVPLVVDAALLVEAASVGDHARVVELYAGQFLDGVHLDDAIEFDRWRDGENARLGEVFARSAAARCAQLARAGQWEPCAALARRWLDVEPASADAALRLIDAIAAPGTHAARVAALIAFEELRERLRCDLGVAPAAVVVKRAHTLSATVAVPEPSPTLAGAAAERAVAAPIIGRAEERQALSEAYARAVAGDGGVVCITGEAGIGKTTLLEAWLSERLANGASMWVARGRCSERLAGAEAYLPLLDALDHLLAGPDGVTASVLLRRVAPLWHAQLSPADPAHSATPTQQRLKRQLAAFVQELTSTRPVVLFLDDVHWSDSSSVDFLAYLTTRLRELRVLVVVTYREDDLRATRHEFLPLALDLQARGVAREVPLPFFSIDEVARYAGRELPPGALTPKLAQTLHALSEGSPLFVAELVRELRARAQCDSESLQCFEDAAGSLADELPRSVRSMVRRKVERLCDEDRRLLAVASVQGVEFDAPVVAAAAGLDPMSVEERLDRMAHDDGVVRRAGERAFAGGTAGGTARYRFVHALYQNALHATLGPARRRAISAAVADAIVAQCGACTTGSNTQLAILYEAAGDPARAVKHFTRAADDAARLFAHREAVLLCHRALALLPSLPDTTERTLTEMRLHFSVGISTMIVDGYAAPEAQAAHAAAATLAAQFDDVESVFPLIAGLFGYYCVAGNVAESARLAARMGEVAKADATSPLVVMSDLAGGLVQHASGNQAAAHATFEHAIARYDPAHHAMHVAMYQFDPGIFSLAQSARTLWLLGYADQALARAEEAVVMARTLDHPGSIAFAMTFLAIVRQFRGEATEALASAEETIAFCDAHDIAQERAWVSPIRGWALAALGRTDEGVAFTHDAVAAYVAAGSQHSLPYYRAMLAEALLFAGSTRDALAECDAGLVTSARIGEVAYDAELYRLRGECLLRGSAAAADAERDMEASLRIARTHGARLYELRAATSLASLWRDQGRVTDARALLAATASWFTEGLNTADLRRASHLLGELQRLERDDLAFVGEKEERRPA